MRLLSNNIYVAKTSITYKLNHLKLGKEYDCNSDTKTIKVTVVTNHLLDIICEKKQTYSIRLLALMAASNLLPFVSPTTLQFMFIDWTNSVILWYNL